MWLLKSQLRLTQERMPTIPGAAKTITPSHRYYSPGRYDAMVLSLQTALPSLATRRTLSL
jgi:hypothetical protein